MAKTKEREVGTTELKLNEVLDDFRRATRKWERYVERKAEKEGISLDPDE